MQNAKKEVIIIYKYTEYKFNTRNESILFFDSKFNIKIDKWFYGKIQREHKQDIQLIILQDKTKYKRG